MAASLTRSLQQSLERYQLPAFDDCWGKIHRGIEKESLRVAADGHIALGRHPAMLGSALTNPYITTDFSEALLEFITPVYTDIEQCLTMLEHIHCFTLQHLAEGELLWVASMPCPLSATALIPLAEYGSSNIGRLKNLYRRGLHHRYGSLMQVIAGLHYNFSMPDAFWPPYRQIRQDTRSLQDFRTASYLHLIRNFHRYCWLLVYLFGASPAACKCFVQGRDHGLRHFDDHSWYLPDATCLRMGKLGYQSAAQKTLFVCYNELQTYVDCLHRAMHEPYAGYEAIGQRRNGEYLQINTNLLQLENEFYSTIRPKRTTGSGERPLDALVQGGIEYVEVRALDLNPYLPLGIDSEQVRFLDTFLLHCLLSESPLCDEREFFEVATNLTRVVEQGRDPELQLSTGAATIGLRDWAGRLLEDMGHSATLLDHVQHTDRYSQSLRQQQAKVVDAGLTPSGRMIRDMREQGLSFFEFAMGRSRSIRDYLQNAGLNAELVAKFEAVAAQSHQRQRQIEAADTQNFDQFLAAWNRH